LAVTDDHLELLPLEANGFTDRLVQRFTISEKSPRLHDCSGKPDSSGITDFWLVVISDGPGAHNIVSNLNFTIYRLKHASDFNSTPYRPRSGNTN
jgi:hypothetical protein